MGRSEGITTWQRWVLPLFLVGLALSFVMVLRSTVAGDQMYLLVRGWYLAFQGELIPHGMPTSAGGSAPGAISSLLVGLPLLIWHDHRAATLLVLLTHVLAYLVLDRVIRKGLGPEERFLFAVLYWLSPWRIYFSGFLWSPNYLFLVGALHLWTAYQLRHQGTIWRSFWHALVIGIGIQIHPAVMLLGIASIVLYWRGLIRVRFVGVGFAVLVVLVSLVPWFYAVQADPSLLPSGTGFFGRGLILVYPLVRGLMYWVRYSSLYGSSAHFCFDFSTVLGASAMSILGPTIRVLAVTVAVATIPQAIWANVRLWRHRVKWQSRRATGARRSPFRSDRDWLKEVIRWSLVAALIAFAISPTTVMSWQVLPLFHLAVLPLVIYGGVLLRSRVARGTARVAAVYVVASLALILVMATASPPYRCGGEWCGVRSVTENPLRSDHVMLDDLKIRQTCPITINDPDGWWPDILPE